MNQSVRLNSLTLSGTASQIKRALNEITKSQSHNCTLAQYTQKALHMKPSLGNP